MLKKNLTYSDIPFFISKNPFNNDLSLVKDVNAIKQSLRNIVMTIVGEKPFNYLFGGNPIRFLFDNLEPSTIFSCRNLIGKNINTFEPRVELRDIIIEQSYVNPNKINIVVIYSILQLGTVDSVSISLERTR